MPNIFSITQIVRQFVQNINLSTLFKTTCDLYSESYTSYSYNSTMTPRGRLKRKKHWVTVLI